MKITVYSASGGVSGGCGGCFVEVYLNGELEGWLSWGGKVKMKHVPEGENTIEIVREYVKRKIKFTSSQNVKIWIKDRVAMFGPCYELLIKGEDIKIIEDQELKLDRWTGQEPKEKKSEEQTNAYDKYLGKYI